MQIAFFPEWLFARVPVSREQAKWLNMLCSGVFVIVIAALALDRVESLPHFCLLQRALGIPCPGCGILHSLNASFHGDFHRAWIANPAGLVLAIALLFQVGGSALLLAGLSAQRRVERFDGYLLKVFACVTLAVWIYRVSVAIL